jgi:hypothetical protein
MPNNITWSQLGISCNSKWSTQDGVWNAMDWATPTEESGSLVTVPCNSFVARRLDKMREARTVCFSALALNALLAAREFIQ